MMGIASLREFWSLVHEDEGGLAAETSRARITAPVKLNCGKTRPQVDQYDLAPPRLGIDTQSSPMSTRVQAYAHYLSYLLGTSLDDDQIVELAGAEPNAWGTGYDLVLWAEPAQSRASQFLFGSPTSRILERVPTSLLITRQPHWPLRQILLVVRSEEAHGQAVNWTIRLAQASGAMVTALVVVPLVSPLPNREVRQQQGLAMLLASDSLLERQSRYVVQRLEDGGLEAALRLRQGSPEQQIRAELRAETYDLVIVAAESKDWWLRRLIGETVEPILSRANCPVLIARPGQA